MILTLKPTDIMEEINGQPTRRWVGETDKGVPVHCYIAAISPQTNEPEAHAAFMAELRSLPDPRSLPFDLVVILP